MGTHAPSEYLQFGISMGPYSTRAHRGVFLSPPLTMGLMLTSSPQGSRSHYSQGRTFCTCSKSTATKQRSIRSEEHTSELQSLMRISDAVFFLNKKHSVNTTHTQQTEHTT